MKMNQAPLSPPVPSALDSSYRQVLFAFHLPPSASTRTIEAGRCIDYVSECYSMNGFKPLGLLFWGSTDTTFVHKVTVGNQSQHWTSAKIPARFFESGRSFAELEALAERGELFGVLAADLRSIWPMDTAEAHNTLRVEVEGPFESFCMWGVVPKRMLGAWSVVVDERSIDGVPGGSQKAKARVYRQRMLSKELVFEAEAPDEADAVRLAQSFIETHAREEFRP